jgi:hypothetical protein
MFFIENTTAIIVNINENEFSIAIIVLSSMSLILK